MRETREMQKTTHLKKNYILHWVFDSKSRIELWIFTHLIPKPPQNNFSCQNVSVEYNYFLNFFVKIAKKTAKNWLLGDFILLLRRKFLARNCIQFLARNFSHQNCEKKFLARNGPRYTRHLSWEQIRIVIKICYFFANIKLR